MLKYKDQIDALPQDDSAHESQKMYIYDLMMQKKPEVVVEIGTHKGVTSLYMAQALLDQGKGHLYTYDPFDYNQQDTFNKFPELKEYITYQKAKGVDSDLDKVDFVFVDGFHEKEHVLAEINHFLPKLTEGAVMVFHDAGGDNERVGVNAAIDEVGLETETIVLDGTMRVYHHSPTPPKDPIK